MLQGSNADLGLPPLQDHLEKGRQRRPLDILEQSEQPRVCFQVRAKAMPVDTVDSSEGCWWQTVYLMAALTCQN